MDLHSGIKESNFHSCVKLRYDAPHTAQNRF